MRRKSYVYIAKYTDSSTCISRKNPHFWGLWGYGNVGIFAA